MGIRMQYTLSGRLCNKSLKEFSDMKDSSFTPGGFAILFYCAGDRACCCLHR